MAEPPSTNVTSYQRLRVLGRGGMGEVFLGRQVSVEGFERLVALKRIRAEYAGDPAFRELFIAEARVMAGLRHPNICQTVDLREIDGDLYLILEYLEGISLSGILYYYGALSPRIVGAILVGVCAGLEHAHRAGVIHRDISPSNIFVTSAGEVKIVDFGVAKVVDEGTTTSGLKGKGPYMSPEQLSGHALDGRSDLFSLAALGYEALTGKPLFKRSTDYLTYQAIVDDPRPSRPDPSPIDDALLRSLAVDRNERYATAKDLARAIESALQPHGGCVSQIELSDLLEDDMGTLLSEAVARTREAGSTPKPSSGPILETAVAAATPAKHSGPMALAPTVANHPRAPQERPRPEPTEPLRARIGSRRKWIGIATLVVAVALLGAWLATRDPGTTVAEPSGGAAHVIDASAEAAGKSTPHDAGAERIQDAGALPAQDASGQPEPDAAATSANASMDAAMAEPARPRGRGYLSIDARPYGTVSINGKRVGNTPIIKKALPVGTHRVVVKSSTGKTRRLRVRIRRGKVTARRIEF